MTWHLPQLQQPDLRYTIKTPSCDRKQAPGHHLDTEKKSFNEMKQRRSMKTMHQARDEVNIDLGDLDVPDLPFGPPPVGFSF